MSELVEEAFRFDAGGQRIEAALHRGGAPLALVALHPHPLYGGDLHNHVVTAVCGAFADAGATTLRFNFRSAGGGGPTSGDAGGEADDARAAIAAVRKAAPSAAVVLAGYSFGAMVAAQIAGDSDLAGLILISPPVSGSPLPALPVGTDTLIVAGAQDALSPASALAKLAGARCRVVSVPGAGHGWWPGVDDLRVEVRAFAASSASRADAGNAP